MGHPRLQRASCWTCSWGDTTGSQPLIVRFWAPSTQIDRSWRTVLKSDLQGMARQIAYDDSLTVCCLIWTHFCKALGVQHRAVGGYFASILYIHTYIHTYIHNTYICTYTYVWILHTTMTMFNNKYIHVLHFIWRAFSLLKRCRRSWNLEECA